MKKILIPILLSFTVLSFLFFYQSKELSDARLHIIFCDVGQGDGILIRTPTGVDIVIDGGPANGKMVACLTKYLPFWDREIEVMFATHPDADHIGGLLDVIQSYRVISFNTVSVKSKTLIYKALKNGIKKRNIPYREITIGDKFTFSDGVELETYWPDREFEAESTNEYSLVQVLKYKDFEVLLTGDITYQILNTLLIPDSFEIFKLPHHGSKTGIDDGTLKKIKSNLAVISVGKSNRYHHPHPSILGFLSKYHLDYVRTDTRGSIEIVTDGVSTRLVN